jgi:hypothetical protein
VLEGKKAIVKGVDVVVKDPGILTAAARELSFPAEFVTVFLNILKKVSPLVKCYLAVPI